MRLLAAVRALLTDPSLAGLSHAARLSAVVLYAKSRAPQGRRDDNRTSIWGAELGRWLGMSESTVHHAVLPTLRKSGALRTQVVTDAKGRPTGLDCLLMPLWQARREGGVAHPLALSKTDLATLLRLVEALFGPGWAPEGREPTPPGLLAGRTGRGAATDRLGLLLLVLNTRASGWLRLCGGSIVKQEGRAAATLARLLGCSPAAARKVLTRLETAGVIRRERRTTFTRMNGRGRLQVLPVAKAHHRGAPFAASEDVQGPTPEISDHPGTAFGDHGPGRNTGAPRTSAVSRTDEAAGAERQERPVGAELHSDHTSVVTPGGSPAVDDGFSGESRGGSSHRPERAGAREDRAPSADAAADRPATERGGSRPLRGENPEKFRAVRTGPAPAPSAPPHPRCAGGGNERRRRRAPLPTDARLRTALAPVSALWEKLSPWQQTRLKDAADAELRRLAGLLERPEAAPEVLAERLEHRLRETGGPARAKNPLGWLLGRGLVQRPACSDVRCDDGIRLDTGGDCPGCGNIVQLRRARRAGIAAEVDAQMPGADPSARKAVVETWLHHHAALDAEDLKRRRQQAETERARRQAACRAAEEERQAPPCEDCGAARSAGLCEVCRFTRKAHALVEEAALIAAAGATAADDAVATAAHVRDSLVRDMATARAHFLDLLGSDTRDSPDQVASALAHNAQMTAEQAVADCRRTALSALARSPQADTEAELAGAAERRRHRDENSPAARAAGQKAAAAARERVAQHLLETRLTQLRGPQERPSETAIAARAVVPAPRERWTDRLAAMTVQPVSGDAER